MSCIHWKARRNLPRRKGGELKPDLSGESGGGLSSLPAPQSPTDSLPQLLARIALFQFAHTAIVGDGQWINPPPDFFSVLIRTLPPEFPEQPNGFADGRISWPSSASWFRRKQGCQESARAFAASRIFGEHSPMLLGQFAGECGDFLAHFPW